MFGRVLIECFVEVQGMQITASPLALPDEEVEALSARRTAEVKALARTTRGLVQEAVPNAFEVIYHGALCYGGEARLSTLKVYISFHTSHVNLGFYFGATLPDKDGLLKGEGKRMRHIKIRCREDIQRRPFQRHVKAALEQA
jgi:hypothetical protein